MMTLGELNKFVIHFIGNKNNGDGVSLSDSLTDFKKINDSLNHLIINSFKFDELFKFEFSTNLDLNPVYRFIESTFDNPNNFIEQSKNIGRYLYDKSTHPQIKGGELCIAYFENCTLNNEIVDCIGFFKSENKDTFLEVDKIHNGFEIDSKKGININKLDKGCLIFNIQKEDGYVVSIVDNTNRLNAQYWKNDFLSIQSLKNDFHQTNQFLGITKQFLTKHIQEDFEISKADQIDFLNRSVDYFKTHQSFDKKDFEEKVFRDDNLIESFDNYNQSFQKENDLDISNTFEISTQAVKKQAKAFKRVLKLDKNFHIYIHGNRDLIEKGIDEKGRKFYKIFYEDEN
ncbi:nucleoid-associated protein [Tenacibaculum halocynthiae]|uniref:nucleoid-associated protein n=1 Tax=Tenacibaculum halocynthiae TaxID=1254437 RepID=UPI003894C008